MENEKQEQELEMPEEESVDNAEQDDLAAELAKYKAIAERKSKQLEKLKAGLDDETETKTNKTNENQPVTEAQRIERLELKVEGYTDNEIDFILKNGGKEALNDEIVKTAIDSWRAKAKSEGATPDGESSKSPLFKRYTQEDLENMPLDELEKIVPKA